MRTGRSRRAATAVAQLLCAAGITIGVGWVGRPIDELAGGVMGTHATLLAPAGPAFAIWAPLYLGLAAHTIWQLTPAGATDPRLDRLGLLPAASMALNVTWLVVVQAEQITASAVVIIALLAVLIAISRRLTQTPAGSRLEWWLVDAVFGLYLGWICVAVGANVAAAGLRAGVAPPAPITPVLCCLLVAALLTGCFLATRRGVTRWLPGGVGWGLAWLGVARATGEPRSASVAAAAFAAAGAALWMVRRPAAPRSDGA